MRRSITLLVYCVVSLGTFSQEYDRIDSICEKAEFAPIKAFFEGYSYTYVSDEGTDWYRVERSFFYRDFRLSLSDSSYKVVRFRLAADLDNGDLLAIGGNEKGIHVDSDNYTGMLRKMTKKSLITVDNICVSRGGRYYRLKPFICYLIK
jgi:hypothetical protein